MPEYAASFVNYKALKKVREPLPAVLIPMMLVSYFLPTPSVHPPQSISTIYLASCFISPTSPSPVSCYPETGNMATMQPWPPISVTLRLCGPAYIYWRRCECGS